MSQKEYANGLWGNPPRDGAPDFVVGSLSILPERFIEWLKTQKPNDKGYVRLDILKRQSGDGWSFPVNDFQPQPRGDFSERAQDEYVPPHAQKPDPSDDLPF